MGVPKENQYEVGERVQKGGGLNYGVDIFAGGQSWQSDRLPGQVRGLMYGKVPEGTQRGLCRRHNLRCARRDHPLATEMPVTLLPSR